MATAETEVLLPSPVPSEPLLLKGHKIGTQVVAGQFAVPITHYIFQGGLDEEELKASFRRVLCKNPALAGRAWLTKDGADVELRFDGELGCPFHIRSLGEESEAFLERLDSRTVTRESFELEQAFERLDVADVGRGKEKQLNKSGPLCCATYFRGQKISMISLALSHMLFDGWSYFSVVRCWDEEYRSPGSSKPLENIGLYNITHLSPPAGVLMFQMAMGAKSRPLRELHTVRASVQEATLEKLRAAARETAVEGSIVSRNDAFVAWLSNILGSKVVGIMADSRGKQGVPKDCFGFALASRFCLPAKGPGKCAAGDVRSALIPSLDGAAPQPTLFTAFSCGADEVMQVNNWAKIQHFPSFGGQLRQTVTTLGLKRMLESSAKNTQRVLQCMPGEYQVTHWGLSQKQAARVVAAWEELGESTSSVSGAEVEDAMVRLGMIPKPPAPPAAKPEKGGGCCRRRQKGA